MVFFLKLLQGSRAGLSCRYYDYRLQFTPFKKNIEESHSSHSQIHAWCVPFCVFKVSLFLRAPFARSENTPSGPLFVKMTARTESDYESDEKFEERTSDEHSKFYFGDCLDVFAQLEHELVTKRIDRFKKIVEIEDVLRPAARHAFFFIRRLISHASQDMVVARCPDLETLQFIFTHFGGRVSHYAQRRLLVQATL